MRSFIAKILTANFVALNHWEDERNKQTPDNAHPHKEYDNFDPFNRMSVIIIYYIWS